MSEKHTGGPAFPVPEFPMQNGRQFLRSELQGMNLRDYFAAKAMQALIEKNGACHPSDAYEMADAMLAARKK